MKQCLTSGLQKLSPITKPPTAAKQFRKGLQSEAYVGIAGREQWKRAALSGGLGLSLAGWGMDALPAISPEDIPCLAEISIDLRVTGFALLVSLLTAALFGPAPSPRARFRGASFCKYVCPIGQFNFAQSLVSPLEVKIRNADVCRACTTYDCIRGNDTRRGCELAIFQPKKSGNLDCTFCLDCVHTCPHQNVGTPAFG